MADRPSLLRPDILSKLQRLELKSRYVVEGVLSGMHRSPHYGASIEFAEHKEYAPGDEIRHVDWKAYGRVDKFYVKRFEQETNLRTLLVLDATGSMAYGRDGGESKIDVARLLLASVAYMFSRQGDAVGLLVASSRRRIYVPPRTGTAHLTELVRALEGVEPMGPTDLAATLADLPELAGRRGFVVVASDMLDLPERAMSVFSRTAARNHEVTLFHTLDADEIQFPFDEMTLFRSLEAMDELLVEPRLIRAAYLREMAEHSATLRALATEAGVELVPVDTSEPIDRVLVRYLSSRVARGRVHLQGHAAF